MAKTPRPDDDFDADAYQLSESYIPFLINRAAIAQLAFSARTFEKFGITGNPKWRVIGRLGTHGTMRVGDIAKLTSIEGPTLSRFLSELGTREAHQTQAAAGG